MRLLACFALLVACTPIDDPAPADGSARTDTAVDVAPDDVTPNDAAPDARPDAAVVCCPMEEPGCSCFFTGRRDPMTGACMPRICDVAPVGNTREVAADGCPYWRTTSQSCLSRPDGG